MARQITKELALKIVDKLHAQRIDSRNKAHDQYAVEENGLVIAFISIRRGSNREAGHDFIPGDLHIGPNQAKRLGQCPMSRQQYIAVLQEHGLIERGEDEEEDEEFPGAQE